MTSEHKLVVIKQLFDIVNSNVDFKPRNLSLHFSESTKSVIYRIDEIIVPFQEWQLQWYRQHNTCGEIAFEYLRIFVNREER